MEMEKNKMENSELLQLVSFNVGSEEFGVEILKVQEIIRLIPITKVPNSPEFVEGIINLRGKVIPVINLRVKLGMSNVNYNNSTRIIVVEINKAIVGFIVDAVSEVLRIPASITEAPPALTVGINSEYITSIAKLEDRMLIFLDIDRLLTTTEEESLELVS